ncbi:GNAT family N-acetyltransferase [Streptomyces sp. GQFP]|uniref:GNAT family N-acetyltransferase n=1 Tax=Streptomyces sp. GQFP TaxID=2907545 RepID=UPI001F1CEFEF|nr:GNAT family N-acetyltransferase [Streptomyces sp. GQFP]UIX33460.1 GNAT family N-acetyltransferase [Streptomyces sp. GQFP]
MTLDVLTLSHYQREHLQLIRSMLVDVYAEVYSRDAADPFHSVQRFEERLSGHAAGSSWACVAGNIDGEPVGYAYGRLDSVREWHEILDPVDPAVRAYGEEGTFGLCEIMVRGPWRGQGIARGIHDELMGRRPEQRASLLVDSEHPKVRALYESWGYRKAGQMQPFEDSPRYDAMVLDLS